MNPQQRFEENVELFARFCPVAALQVQDEDSSQIHFCQTERGELNLVKKKGTKEIYFHDQCGAADEAKTWLEEIFPLGVKVIFLYGVGLGYYYDALKSWLQDDPGRYLVFLDDDLAALKLFLETEKAGQILRDPQVVVQYFNTPGQNDWGKFRADFDWCFWGFCIYNWQFYALKMYAKERESLFKLLYNQFSMVMGEYIAHVNDVIDHNELIYTNVYFNMAYSGQSGFAHKLFGQFEGIPAIICGAGPSLGKQIPLLKTLADKALIVASGTALNILNNNGIIPHFGSCVDPTATQESRFMTNTAYELPVFYSNRFHHGAFTKIHGPRLSIGGTPNYRISDWFDQELGLQPNDFTFFGISTSNVCNEIAGALKCDPIIFIGMDLAYTDSSRYAPGVTAHPTDDRKQHEEISKVMEKTYPVPGFNEGTVNTRLDWLIEAGMITSFSLRHPENHVINATEGGMKIMEIPNLPFKDVIGKYLSHSYDLQGWIHAEIQQSSLPEITSTKVLEAMEKWGESLKRCTGYCNGILQELEKKTQGVGQGNNLDPITESGLISLYLEDLKGEPGWIYFLETLNRLFVLLIEPQVRKLKCFPEAFTELQKNIIRAGLECDRYGFFKKFADFHARTVTASIQAFRQNIAKSESRAQESIPEKPKIGKEDIYLFDSEMLLIQDKEMGIDYRSPFNPGSEESVRILHPNGSCKGEMFLKKGNLHGPSSFYDKAGNLLSRAWYIDGKKFGKTWLYYCSGNVYALLRYQNGKLHKLQQYYYPDGTLKTILEYDDGLLNGEARLYYPNGRVKRVLHFVKGRLHGEEKIWDESGLLIVEAEYRNNLPFGKSRMWHSNGQLAKEIVFYENPKNFDMHIWDEKGKLVHKQLYAAQEPIADMITKSKELKKTLEDVQKRLNQIKDRSKNKNS